MGIDSSVVTSTTCPICKHPLRATIHDDTHCEQCTQCHGVFFQRHAVEQCAQRIRCRQNSATIERRKFVLNRKRGALQCPHCAVLTMHEGNIAGTKLWRCNSCTGFFISHRTLRTLFIGEQKRSLFTRRRKKGHCDSAQLFSESWDTLAFTKVFFRV